MYDRAFIYLFIIKGHVGPIREDIFRAWPVNCVHIDKIRENKISTSIVFTLKKIP